LPPQLFGFAACLFRSRTLALRGLARQPRGFLLRHALGLFARLAFCLQLGAEVGFHPLSFLARLAGALQRFPLALRGGLSFPLCRLRSGLRFPFGFRARFRCRPQGGFLRRLYRRRGFCANLGFCIRARLCLGGRAGLRLHFLARAIVEQLLLFGPRLGLRARFGC
jgi:hypothetical protein